MTPLVLSSSVVAPQPSSAPVPTATATVQPGVRHSKHDFSASSGSAGPKSQRADQNQLCVYCHTPHRAGSTQTLWGRPPSATTAYSWGNDAEGAVATTAGGTLLPALLRPASRRCLGCHDGTVALGDVTNAGGGTAGLLAGLEGIAGLTDGAGRLSDPTHLVGAGGALGGNHPISVPYPSQTYNGRTSALRADGTTGHFYAVVRGGGCTSTSGICTAAPATDGRDGAAINLVPMGRGEGEGVGVECSTCHEPHNKYAPNPFLTRVDVSNASGLCRSCHNQ